MSGPHGALGGVHPASLTSGLLNSCDIVGSAADHSGEVVANPPNALEASLNYLETRVPCVADKCY